MGQMYRIGRGRPQGGRARAAVLAAGGSRMLHVVGHAGVDLDPTRTHREVEDRREARRLRGRRLAGAPVPRLRLFISTTFTGRPEE